MGTLDQASDPDFRFTALERWVLGLLKVPPEPQPPEGSPDSIRIFRAGRNYYRWSVLVWAIVHAAIFGGLFAVTVVTLLAIRRAPEWAQLLWGAAAVFAWIAFGLSSTITFLSRRLNYDLRWYIVTDRSLRIRSGVFTVNELTMTYGNIQEIRVSAGPLQHVLGLADVEVHSAGGGGDSHGDTGHIGRFEGLSNADAVRDFMVERLRQYRDSGLGGDAGHSTLDDPFAIAAATAVLEEVRGLRGALMAQH